VSVSRPECPLRIGVFGSAEDAEKAVRALVAEGFAKERVSVLCSDPDVEARFREFEHQHPAGAGVPSTARKGSVIGGVAGGLVGVAGIAAAGPGFLAAEPLCIGAGMLFGTFVGAMLSSGMEHELANYYDQSLRRGQILVAAEIGAGEDAALLERAEAVLEAAGAHPVPLPRG
jgi:hypothetical protein